MMRIHWMMCFPKRIAYFWYGLLVLFTFVFYFFAIEIAQTNSMNHNDIMMQTQYLIQGVEVIKWGILSISMVLVLMAFSVQKYTIMMLYYTTKQKLIITKIIVLDVIIVLWIVSSSSILFLIGFPIGGFSFSFHDVMSLCKELLVFGLLYQHMMIFLYLIKKHIIMIPLVHILYVLSSTTLDYFMKKSDASYFLEFIQLLLPDIVVFESLSIEMFHSSLWYVIVIITLFYGIYYTFIKSDFIK